MPCPADPTVGLHSGSPPVSKAAHSTHPARLVAQRWCFTELVIGAEQSAALEQRVDATAGGHPLRAVLNGVAGTSRRWRRADANGTMNVGGACTWSKAAAIAPRYAQRCSPSGGMFSAVTAREKQIAQHEHGELDRALQNLEEALALCKERNDVPGQVNCLKRIGGVHETAGRFHITTRILRGALRFLEHAQELHHATGNQRGLASTLNNIGGLLEQQGNVEAAMDNYSTALAIFQKSGKRVDEALAHHNLRMALRAVGRLKEARSHGAASCALYSQVGLRMVTGT